ncbi:hypothetical protein CSC12_1202 [Klebsiella michiganensis]|nr:hypothetical protein CSC12_1202 [Klebsiella michiganensis]
MLTFIKNKRNGNSSAIQSISKNITTNRFDCSKITTKFNF